MSELDLQLGYQRARRFLGIPEDLSLPLWRWAEEPSVRECGLQARTFPVLGPRQLGHRHSALFAGESVHLRLGVTVTRLVMSQSGKEVDHIVGFRADGAEVRISAGAYVLAVGGIEVPRLLLASADTRWPDGVGNDGGLVGRCFMEHPHLVVCLANS